MKETTENTIRVERARHKITQGTLAQNIGCARQTICLIESGKIQPSIIITLKIVRYFNELKLAAGMELIRVEDIFKLKPI